MASCTHQGIRDEVLRDKRAGGILQNNEIIVLRVALQLMQRVEHGQLPCLSRLREAMELCQKHGVQLPDFREDHRLEFALGHDLHTVDVRVLQHHLQRIGQQRPAVDFKELLGYLGLHAPAVTAGHENCNVHIPVSLYACVSRHPSREIRDGGFPHMISRGNAEGIPRSSNDPHQRIIRTCLPFPPVYH